MEFQNELKNYILQLGASDVGFFKAEDFDSEKCKYGISITVRVSEAVIDEVKDKPTHTYFHHYRTVNAFIDRIILETGLYLQKNGYSYIPIGASQSINEEGWNFKGRYSSRKAACLAKLGTIGKNNMFIHRDFGPAVRLGTIFTDCVLETEDRGKIENYCLNCDKCVKACPSNALKGNMWTQQSKREDIIDAEKCSSHMKEKFKMIGRGAVCGICMSVCPLRKNILKK